MSQKQTEQQDPADEKGRIRTPISPATWTEDQPAAEPESPAAEPAPQGAPSGPGVVPIRKPEPTQTPPKKAG